MLLLIGTPWRLTGRAGPALLVILVIFLYLLFGQDRAYFGSCLFLQISGLASIGFQQLSVFRKQFFKVRAGRLKDALKLLPLLCAEFEEIVKLLI